MYKNVAFHPLISTGAPLMVTSNSSTRSDFWGVNEY